MDEPTEIQLTVSGLIELLMAYPPDSLVFSEGCDCRGEAVSVQVEHELIVDAQTGKPTKGPNPGVLICR